MLTVYSPVRGVVRSKSQQGDPAGGSATVAAVLEIAGGAAVQIDTPMRGDVQVVSANQVSITDSRDRSVTIHLLADDGEAEALVADGAAVGFNTPLLRWTGPAGSAATIVLTTTAMAGDVVDLTTEGQQVTTDSDLFNLGPFGCGG